jgi:hypothetical protein
VGDNCTIRELQYPISGSWSPSSMPSSWPTLS